MGAETNQPDSALLATYYDPETDANVKFDNEEGGNLVDDPTDAAGGKSSDVEGPGPSEVLFQEDSRNETKLNDHVNATSDPMGNTEASQRKSASGVTAYAKED
jgi:hypothetical protein